jgi:hypothetical protein
VVLFSLYGTINFGLCLFSCPTFLVLSVCSSDSNFMNLNYLACGQKRTGTGCSRNRFQRPVTDKTGALR